MLKLAHIGKNYTNFVFSLVHDCHNLSTSFKTPPMSRLVHIWQNGNCLPENYSWKSWSEFQSHNPKLYICLSYLVSRSFIYGHYHLESWPCGPATTFTIITKNSLNHETNCIKNTFWNWIVETNCRQGADNKLSNQHW